MKIAITSQNFRDITGHAGKARRFLIYEADQSSGEAHEIERLDLPKEMSMHYFSGEQHPIDQVDVLITGGCGDGFMQRMEMRGVGVIKTSETNIALAVQAAAKGEPLASPMPHPHEQRVSIQIK
jgi:predicted Fe-Mo cluster-binding NifX family protein